MVVLPPCKSPLYSCNPALRSGFWNVAETVVTAESRLEFQKLLGYHQTNRAGFGSFHQPEIPCKDSHAIQKVDIFSSKRRSTFPFNQPFFEVVTSVDCITFLKRQFAILNSML